MKKPSMVQDSKLISRAGKGVGIGAATLILQMSGLVATEAYATGPHYYPGWKSGNAHFECQQLARSQGLPNYTYAFKVDGAPRNGVVYNVNGQSITLSQSRARSFVFSSNFTVDTVIVKAGQDINWYGRGLRHHYVEAPNGKQISHFTFCWR